jgi:hypothetical protein
MLWYACPYLGAYFLRETFGAVAVNGSFFFVLPFGSFRANWRPVYDIEQRTRLLKKESEQLKKENARLAAIQSRLAHFEREHLSGSNRPDGRGLGVARPPGRGWRPPHRRQRAAPGANKCTILDA